MSTNMLIAENSKTLLVDKNYLVNKGLTEEISKLYLVDAGKLNPFFEAAFAFSFEGSSSVTGDLNGDFCVEFTTSGKLTILSLGKASDGVDIFSVARGAKGGDGSYHSTGPWTDSGLNWWLYAYTGGKGGPGGACVTTKGLAITAHEYYVHIGDASDPSTWIRDEETKTRIAIASGAGASANGDGSYAFGDDKFATSYGAGMRFGPGGGDGYSVNQVRTSSPSGQGNSDDATPGRNGGLGNQTYRGGDGAKSLNANGGNATAPGGGGGGGGGRGNYGNDPNYFGGAPANGYIALRNKRD